jgi:Na+-transporting NADH:ubiquinone oxidoreductase subunit B
LRHVARAVDPGWLMTSWLFVLLLPPAVSPLLAVLAVSFGVVFGAHIFGGTGKYLLSPALLGVLFLHFSYPEFVQADLPVSGFSGATGWVEVARQGVAVAADAPGFAALLLGRELGAIGTGSALACMAGAAYLVFAGVVSWRTLAGAFVGLFVAAGIANLFTGDDPAWGIPWYTHLVVGNFAFGVAFLATDPSVGPLTRPARWAYGALIGLLTLIIRVVDPNHPEGSLYAILLAGLTVPLLDYLVVRRHRRHQSRPLVEFK